MDRAEGLGTSPGSAAEILVECVFSPGPRQVWVHSCTLRAPHTVGHLLKVMRQTAPQAWVAALWPSDDAHPALAVGRWAKVVPHAQGLRSGDRVEFWRPLQADPIEARRAKVASAPRPKRVPLPPRKQRLKADEG